MKRDFVYIYNSISEKGFISYNVDTDSMMYYYDFSSNIYEPDIEPLESLDFNYIEILNNIMNELIDIDIDELIKSIDDYIY